MTKRQRKSSRRNVRRVRAEIRRRRARQVRELARAFNEWMRRYTFEPERFEREFNTVADFRHESRRGREPSYGRACAEYLLRLIEDT